MRPFRVLLLACGLLPAFAQASPPTPQANPPVARVGGVVLHAHWFNLQWSLFARQVLQAQGLPFTPQTEALLRPVELVFLKRLALDQAAINEAERLGLAPSPKEVQAALAQDIARARGASRFQAALHQLGFRLGEYQRLIYNALAYRAYIDRLKAELPPVSGAARLIYELSLSAYWTPPRYCAEHILVKSLKEAEHLLNLLHQGASFETLARRDSLDTASAAQGGNLGCAPPSAYVAPFAKALSELAPGQIGGPVKSPYGYHLIRLLKILPGYEEPFQKVRPEIEASIQDQAINLLLQRLYQAQGGQVYPQALGLP